KMAVRSKPFMWPRYCGKLFPLSDAAGKPSPEGGRTGLSHIQGPPAPFDDDALFRGRRPAFF
ncbi:MAG: hypothetical protein V2B18_21840, partial [Pseudomonadota bacterium]